jgi:iron complex outermembrane receptor protein
MTYRSLLSMGSNRAQRDKKIDTVCRNLWPSPRHGFFCVIALLLSLAGARPGWGADDRIHFDIPPDRADRALNLFAQQADVQLLYPYDLATGLTLERLSGRYTAYEGLKRLVAGTCLRAELGPRDQLILRANEKNYWGNSMTRCQRPGPLSALFTAILTTLHAVPITAQELPRPQVTAIEEMVVAARRREETVQSIPLSITALDQEALLSRNVKEAIDLQYMSPSLTITTGASGSVSLRGLGQGFGGSAPAVVSYLDEVALNTQNVAASVGFFDLQNVQVLKGPQGTLFGRNTTGGAIVYTSNRPIDSFEGYAKVTGGSHDLVELEGAINVPLVAETLALRISGQSREREGYVDNITTGKDMNNVDQQALRLGLLWQISDTVENYLAVNYLESDTNGSAYVLEGVRSAPTSPARMFYGNTFDTLLAQQQARGIRKVAANWPERSHQKNTLITDIITWEVNDRLTLKNIAHYSENDTPLNRTDFDGSPRRLIEIESRDASIDAKVDELQLQGNLFDQRLEFITGLYYEHITNKSAQYTYQFMDATVPSPIGPIPIASTQYQPTETVQRSKALFGQVTYDLGDFVDGLTLTAGARRTWDERDTERSPYLSNLASGFNFVCNPAPPAGQPCLYGAGAKWNQNTWTVGLDYQITPEAMVYVARRKGYKAGGFNAFAPSPSELLFNPELVTDWEVGAKLDWHLFGTQARTNIAAYRSKFDDIQRTDSFLNGTSFTNFITNTAEATIDGIELEITLLPTDALQIDLLYSYTDAGYDDYIDRNGNDLSDQPFASVSKNRASLRASYRVPISGEFGQLTLFADYAWQDEMVTNPVNDLSVRESTIDEYALINARVQWSNVMRSRFDVGLFGTNLADEEYVVGQVAAGDTLGFTNASYGPPRMWGIDLRYNF